MLINFYVVDDIKAFSTLKMDGSTLFSRYFLLISVVLFVCFTECSKALLIPTYVTHVHKIQYYTHGGAQWNYLLCENLLNFFFFFVFFCVDKKGIRVNILFVLYFGMGANLFGESSNKYRVFQKF